MCAIRTNQQVKVYIQQGDALLDVSGVIQSVSVTQYQDEVINLEISVTGTGLWTTGKELMSHAREITRHKEWKCDYCGHINKTEQRFCGQGTAHGCGAVRPFIYE